MVKMDECKISLDHFLDKFSIFGRYHLQFMISAMIAFTCDSMYSATYIFVTEEIGYKCVAEEAFSNYTCGDVNGVRCTKWIYENPHSFVAEFDLACQDWKRTLVGSAQMFGYMIGLLLIGLISDRIGRKNTFIGTGLVSAIIGLTKSFSHSYWFYVILECLNSMLGDICLPLYILSLEIVSSKKRVIFNLFCCLGVTLGSVFISSVAWAIPYWRYFLRAVHTPALVYISLCACCALVDESPRWLLTRGKKDNAIAILKKMALKNKVDLETDVLNNILVEKETENTEFVNVIKITFQSRVLLKRFLVCLVWMTTSTFTHYGTMIYSVSLQGNQYINYALVEFIRFPGDFLSMYVLNNLKRRNPLIFTLFAAAALFFVHPFLPTNGVPWLKVAMFMASKLMTCMYFNISYMYTSELFPTCTRNSMHALCSSIGRIGAIVAPQTPLLMAYWNELPTVLFGGASLVGGLVTFLVPDTADNALPDTVREAEDIGVKNKQEITGNNLEMTNLTNK